MYSVEFSRKQICLHIDELDKTLIINRRKFQEDKENDWQILNIFDNMEEADKYAEKVWNNEILPRYHKK